MFDAGYDRISAVGDYNFCVNAFIAKEDEIGFIPCLLTVVVHGDDCLRVL